jgi:hypothetical protein
MQVRGVPFYGQDGSHRATLPVEIDAQGLPPSGAQLIGSDESGRLMLCRYRREPGAGGGCRWAWRYSETGREAWTSPGAVTGGGPRAGSDQALLRLFLSRGWGATAAN